MTHGMRKQAGWDPVDSADMIRRKAAELVAEAEKVAAALGRGDVAAARARMAPCSAAAGHVSAHLALLRRGFLQHAEEAGT